jgi:hypothetical protein
MDEETILDSAVAQKDRISVDVTDIKEEIENCRSDVAWAELALAAKVRVLIKERLQEIARQNGSASPKEETPSPSKSKGDK